ncbi:hypothetical protein J7L49_06530 [Candidatus Bathyarchaeota archaeon]|nr:hypothetical protein [Candidatus Bathyarchaeota archaeon]
MNNVIKLSYREKISFLNPPVLEFKANRKDIDPIRAFAVHGYEPFESPSLRSIPEIDILIPKNDKECEKVETILEDLKKGKMTGRFDRSKYKPFKETYGFEFKLNELREYEDESDVNEEIRRISKLPNKKEHILVIVSTARSPLGGFYYNVKTSSIMKEVQTQIILKRTIKNYFQKMTEEEKGDFLWNFSLSVFAKLGGIPWKLNEVLSGVAAFISLNTVSTYEQESSVTERKGVVALEIANAWGDPLGRFFGRETVIEREKGAIIVDLESIDQLVKNSLDMIENELVDVEKSKEKDFIIFHVKDRYAESVYDKIGEVITSEGFKNFKIIHIQKRGSLRLFNPQEKIHRAWPREGSYWYLQKGKIAFLYTLGRWQYSLRSEPYTIGARDVSPLQVNLARSDGDSILTREDLRPYILPY